MTSLDPGAEPSGGDRFEWGGIQAGYTQIMAAFATAYELGVPADHPFVVELSEAYRRHLQQFHPCDVATYRALVAAHAADPATAARIDADHFGLAAYLAEAATALPADSGS